ncbi:hypothetical protein KBA73_03870 [Patescibacteria group bacterium]|nr:hypothetical protein [Patescibacteria group bacterium]
MPKPHLYFQGLLDLVSESTGEEVVHIGIRPYGFHAGNALTFVAYPYLLCKYLEKSGKEPKIQFIISINDWEQDALDGPDPRTYPFNIYPKNTSLQFTEDEQGCCSSVVEHWQPVIERSQKWIQERFPAISFRYVRNSELLQEPHCQRLLRETIREPKRLLDIFKTHSSFPTMEEPLTYGGVICPNCRRAHGTSTVIGETDLAWNCRTCALQTQRSMQEFQYWWYHKPLLLARMELFKIDITLSGGDHFSEGDFQIRQALIQEYSPQTKEPKMLFAPTLLALNGQKMSKSRNNTAYAHIERLIHAVDGMNEKEFLLTPEHLLPHVDETNYRHLL